MTEDGRRPEREVMSPERWARLEPLIDAALELPAADRDAYLDRLAVTDPALGAEVRRLIHRSEATGGLFEVAAVERFGLLFDGDETAEPGRADLARALQTSLGTAYTLERELGGGGMSRVFVAHEPALGRQVVIKVLSPELAAGINADRFAREIKVAASLQQANIVPLLSAGTAGGFPYYTMPFVEGRSLRERLAREGRLPVGDAIGVLRDVARALAFAHARGVVHRDIKPGNVLLSGGTAVVTDFGIAKALAAAAGGGRADRADQVAMTLTEAGTSLGTPAYMAPEQATGDPSTDHRADLYAFGCLAYEVFAGATPFHGGPVHKVIAAHLKETPRPLAESRADVPEPIAALVHRCLEKDPAHRPQDAGEVLASLEGGVQAISQSVPRPRAPGSTQRRGAIIGVTVVALAVAIGALTRVGRPAIGEPMTLALAPFDVSRDTALESRSDGIRDEILTGMAKVAGVRIVGRIAGARYKPRIGLTPDVRAIARDLGARLLVTGTMRASGGRVTLSVQLNDSATTGEVWSDEFVRDSADLPSLTDTVVRTLADTLRARFGSRIGGARIAGVRGPRVANDAFVEWALGREALNRRGAQVEAGIAHFERAIALDPRFAQAHASLATALQLRPYFMGTPPATIRDSTLQEATLALQLDSTLSDAHAALGAMYAHAGQWDSATVEFRHALALQPENATARLTYARILIVRGQTTEGLAELRDAARTERDWPVIGAWLSYALFLTGQVDSAIAESDRAVTREPGLLPATNLGSLMNLALGRTQKAHDLVAVMPPVSVMTYAAYVYAKLGDTVTANALVHAMESSHPRPWFTDIARATVRLAVGDSAAALGALEAGARASGPTWYMYAPVADPMWDLVRNSPRFIALLRFAEIDPAHIERSWRSSAR